MRWYQTLFWRIFGTVWLVSMLGIGISLALYLTLADPQARQAEQLDRARWVAERIISAYEHQEEPRLGRLRHFPLWILDENGQQIYGQRRRPDADLIPISVQGDSGAVYQVRVQLSPESLAFDRLLTFVLSIQAVWVLAVSLMSSLFLAWLVVRPINALRRHVRVLYDDQNLSHRAEGRLSQRSDELGQLAREFNQMADYVEQTLGNQEALLRDVSHELRAPLARLHAALGLAEQRWGVEDKVILRLSREAAQLERLISEILALSREVNAPGGPCWELNQLLEALVEDARMMGPEHRVHVESSVAPGRVELFEEPISRIISNLLGNALSHTPPGTDVWLKVALRDSKLYVQVKDKGPGVEPALLAQLDRPFKRSANSTGYGLGLSICKRAVERMCGEINFRNGDGGGFVAEVWVPQPDSIGLRTTKTPGGSERV